MRQTSYDMTPRILGMSQPPFFSYASSSTLYACQWVRRWAEFQTSVAWSLRVFFCWQCQYFENSWCCIAKLLQPLPKSTTSGSNDMIAQLHIKQNKIGSLMMFSSFQEERIDWMCLVFGRVRPYIHWLLLLILAPPVLCTWSGIPAHYFERCSDWIKGLPY